MAPAVRLFRSQSFSMRALLISVVFLVPILVLSWILIHEKRALIASSHKELAGVSYIAALYPVLESSTDLMVVALDGGAQERSAARANLTPKLDELAKAHNLNGGLPGTESAYAALEKSLKAADAAADGMPAFVAYSRYLDQVMALMSTASDSAGLALDSEMDVYYLGDYLTKDLPRLTMHTAQAGAAGLAAIKAKAVSPLVQRVLSDNEVIIGLHFAELKNSVAKVVDGDSELAAALQHEKAFTESQALYKVIGDAISDAISIDITRDQFAPKLEGALKAQRHVAAATFKQINVRLNERIQSLKAALWGMAAGILLLLALAFYLFFAFYLVTIGGMRKTSEHLMAITDGDLTTTPRPWGRDEAAKLMLTLDEMQTSVRTVVQQVRESAEHIVMAVGEVAAGANDLAQRTAQGAASVESAVSATNEISEGIQKTSQSADQAAQIAAQNASVAERGHQVIGSVINTMDEIQTSSRRIGDIIGVIDSIAFQTNILALNAAVEAARAGEQGRGFAVVASEVRTLAQRSAEAAKEIKQLILMSVNCVDAGTQVVQGAGATMQEIVANADTLKQLLGTIAVAAREQAQLVAEVESTMHDIDSSTQQNAALVEQSAASAEAMRQQADNLQHQVERFRIS